MFTNCLCIVVRVMSQSPIRASQCGQARSPRQIAIRNDLRSDNHSSSSQSRDVTQNHVPAVPFTRARGWGDDRIDDRMALEDAFAQRSA